MRLRANSGQSKTFSEQPLQHCSARSALVPEEMFSWRGAFPLWQNDSGEIDHLELYDRDGRAWVSEIVMGGLGLPCRSDGEVFAIRARFTLAQIAAVMAGCSHPPHPSSRLSGSCRSCPVQWNKTGDKKGSQAILTKLPPPGRPEHFSLRPHCLSIVTNSVGGDFLIRRGRFARGPVWIVSDSRWGLPSLEIQPAQVPPAGCRQSQLASSPRLQRCD